MSGKRKEKGRVRTCPGREKKKAESGHLPRKRKGKGRAMISCPGSGKEKPGNLSRRSKGKGRAWSPVQDVEKKRQSLATFPGSGNEKAEHGHLSRKRKGKAEPGHISRNREEKAEPGHLSRKRRGKGRA
jgi:hypothetical protein